MKNNTELGKGKGKGPKITLLNLDKIKKPANRSDNVSSASSASPSLSPNQSPSPSPNSTQTVRSSGFFKKSPHRDSVTSTISMSSATSPSSSTFSSPIPTDRKRPNPSLTLSDRTIRQYIDEINATTWQQSSGEFISKDGQFSAILLPTIDEKTGAPGIHIYSVDEQRKLGSGGFADVFMAYDLSQQNNVMAVKVFRERFDKEASDELRILTHLKRCKGGFVRPGKKSMIFMSYCAGTTLEYYLKQLHDSKVKLKQIFSPLDILVLSRQLLQQLKDIHEHKVLHREINPRNIILGPEAAIIDFNDAIRMDEPILNNDRPITPGFTSPNAIDRLTPPTYADDIYSLALTLAAFITSYDVLKEIEKLVESWAKKDCLEDIRLEKMKLIMPDVFSEESKSPFICVSNYDETQSLIFKHYVFKPIQQLIQFMVSPQLRSYSLQPLIEFLKRYEQEYALAMNLTINPTTNRKDFMKDLLESNIFRDTNNDILRLPVLTHKNSVLPRSFTH